MCKRLTPCSSGSCKRLGQIVVSGFVSIYLIFAQISDMVIETR